MRSGLRIDDAYTYQGIDAVFLENRALRILVLPGKGGDIVEFRDKRTDIDVLYHTDHDWAAVDTRRLADVDGTSWHDHYPGGWQVNLPVAGYTQDFGGTPYGLHGESALLPWDVSIVQNDDDAVSLHLSLDLVRYPFTYERTLTLPVDEASLQIEESITNTGRVPVEYIWQQHVALGPPLLGPRAKLTIPAQHGLVEAYGEDHRNERLVAGESFEWPTAPSTDGSEVDLSIIPGREATIHDVAFATELTGGWYTLVNPTIDLGFGFSFPTDPFECVWYWQAFHGVDTSPYFGRNYNVGLEPTTAYPSRNVPTAQREQGTLKTLAPDETISASFAAVTFPSDTDVSGVSVDGAIK